MLTLKRRYVDAADHIICISEATKKDLLSVYPEVQVPVSVIHLGVDDKFVSDLDPLPDLPDQYVLMVGHRGQYKDAAVLFRAFSRIAGRFPEVSLVCIGGGAFTKDERGLLERLGVAGRVRQDVLSDPRMPAAYANAMAFVFPSRYEGFGLPVLEAMACGTPTILAEATSLPEVGGQAARYFPVGDDESLAEVLGTVLDDATLRAELAAKGIERAAGFTWRRTAEATARVYDEVIATS